MTANCKIRFANNNFLGSGITSTPFQTAYPLENIYDSRRGVVGKFQGSFVIDSGNQYIYIDDGALNAVLLTPGTYTGTTLAAHIQTRLNVASTNWTCTYSATTYKFTIDRSSGTKIIALSQTVDSVWDAIGFTGGVDDAVGPFESYEMRIHHYEFIKVDLGLQRECNFAGIVAPIGQAIGLSPDATVRIQGNNIDTWYSPQTDVEMQVNGLGAFGYPDETHRYWRIKIQDRGNPQGPNALSIGYASISSTVAITNTSIAVGFSESYVDPSVVLVSENGTKYFDTRQKYLTISGEIQAAFGDERRELEQFFYDYGVSLPFFMSIDPQLSIFENQGEVTKLVRFESVPSLQNIIRDYFNISISVSEVV